MATVRVVSCRTSLFRLFCSSTSVEGNSHRPHVAPSMAWPRRPPVQELGAATASVQWPRAGRLMAATRGRKVGGSRALRHPGRPPTESLVEHRRVCFLSWTGLFLAHRLAPAREAAGLLARRLATGDAGQTADGRDGLTAAPPSVPSGLNRRQCSHRRKYRFGTGWLRARRGGTRPAPGVDVRARPKPWKPGSGPVGGQWGQWPAAADSSRKPLANLAAKPHLSLNPPAPSTVRSESRF